MRGGHDESGPTIASTRTVSVCAIVVTRDRRELLARCLKALSDQTRTPDEILVVDNASSDGSAEAIRAGFPDVKLMRLEENVGGAGGFSRGLAWGFERGHDWLWLMDDDTFCVPDTLETLLEGGERAPEPPLVLASRVVWKDENLHPMNRPWIWWRKPDELAEAADRGLVRLRAATFVSMAIRREAVARFDLPLEHYFLWTDDIEYSARILRDEPGYLVPESKVYHWTQRPHTALSASGERFYFHVRNSILLVRGTSLRPNERVTFMRFWVTSIYAFLRRNPSRDGLRTVLSGIRDGLRMEVR
jgi:rhamnopyranosyl-N-acetylglucosaminyl-diphospho-decaprenol beta-1,3/1,4-galactofuranosyltransferase